MICIKYELANRSRLEALGVRWDALEKIFSPREQSAQLLHLEGLDPQQEAYYQREMNASQIAYDAIRTGELTVPNIFSGQPAGISQSSSSGPTYPNGFVSIPILFQLLTPKEHYLVSTGLSGRISHVFIPSDDTIIYDLNQETARRLGELLMREIGKRPASAVATGRRVGVVNMVTNFGHQLINHLSGIDRLISCELVDKIDEIWISGAHFFGDPKHLFPSLASKITHFDSKDGLAARLYAEGHLAVHLGSYYLGERLRRSILERTKSGAIRARDSFPIIAVTTRSAGRVCTNLVDVVYEIFQGIKTHYPNVRIMIDGWVFSESEMLLGSSAAMALWSPQRHQLATELQIARQIANRLPKNAILRTTIGMSMLDSIASLQDTDVYFAHVGTLQHKLGFLTSAAGIIHGPKEQLLSRNPGTYQVASGKVPAFIDPNAVEDVDVAGPRGRGFNDYRITDTSHIIELLLSALRSAEPRT